MSVNKTNYVIVGYDFTKFRDILLKNDWKWESENEKYYCYQREGKIQFFDDPMSGDYLYFGYIYYKSDEYDDSKMCHIPISDFQTKKQSVDEVLKEMGWTYKLPKEPIRYEVIAFTECR